MSDVCPLCGSERSVEVFRMFRPKAGVPSGRHTEDLFGRAGAIVRCTSCRLVRQLEPLSAPYADAEDPEYVSEEPGIRATFRGILERVESHRKPPGRLLDVGCGPGFLVDEANRRGWTATGIEPSSWAVARARRDGLDVVEGTLTATSFDAGSFDVVTAADVIEHVADPLAFLAAVERVLAPGGVAFIATPNVESLVARLLRRWWWSVIPNHLVLFSPSTLERAVSSVGLSPVGLGTHPKTFSAEYYAGRCGGYAPLVGTIARRIARMLLGDRLVKPDFRDRIYVVVVKQS